MKSETAIMCKKKKIIICIEQSKLVKVSYKNANTPLPEAQEILVLNIFNLYV